jgi:predicted short-subunit dehydrogenase-like oxidoreductase (DUF2520 family)
MKIGFIGAGKVGTAFGTYLYRKGYSIQGYYSRTMASALKAAEKTNSLAYKTAEELAIDTDFLLITTSDDEIKGVCDRLAGKGAFHEGQIIAHMSGACSSRILQTAKEKGCYTYSLHPLQSFADESKALEDLEHTYFSIEGDLERLEVVEAFFRNTGNVIFRIATEHKGLYHVAACVFSNYLVTLMNQGLMYFEKSGIPKEEGFKAIIPLVLGTLKNIEALGPEKALTGPIARGDRETVLKHIKAIEKEMPEALAFYKLLGQMTLSLASDHKLRDLQKAEEIKEILREV